MIHQKKDCFFLSLAGRKVRVCALYQETRAFCQDFLCETGQESAPDLTVNVMPEMIRAERMMAAPGENWPDEYLEKLAIYREICERMPAYRTFLCHGAAVAAGNEAFLFTGPSGVGKSTHVRKWMKEGKDIRVINGDKPLIRVEEERAVICGTPWRGKENWGGPEMVLLKAIVLMHRAEENEIHPIPFEEALPFLLSQTYRPRTPSMMHATLQLLMALQQQVLFYHFNFNNWKSDAYAVAWAALSGGNARERGGAEVSESADRAPRRRSRSALKMEGQEERER